MNGVTVHLHRIEWSVSDHNVGEKISGIVSEYMPCV